MNKILAILVFVFLGTMTSCLDDEHFSSSKHDLLFFPIDTIRLDTVFSNVPTSTQSMWVYNRTDHNIRCTSVRLEGGNQFGYRVNVDGTFLSQELGYQAHDVEIRKEDSIRVFVELTSPMQYKDTPQKVEDKLTFELESGAKQEMVLNAYSWDALLLKDLCISKDSVLGSDKAIVVHGDLRVDSAATLTLSAGATLYFAENAGVCVAGRLKIEGTPKKEVVLRGDALGNLFDNLPYDRIPGRWQGIRISSSSYGNEIKFADIHGAYHGIVLDSSDVSKQKLLLENTIVHNCMGYGVAANHVKMILNNCQLSNTKKNCLYVKGADVEANQVTVAQFYPFQGERAVAVNLEEPILNFRMINSLITGYQDTEVSWKTNGDQVPNFQFDHCVMRMDKVVTEDSLRFSHVVYETPDDTVRFGAKHFKAFDTVNYIYDFRLSPSSAAIGAADPKTALPMDRNFVRRDDEPDAGCYEYSKALP